MVSGMGIPPLIKGHGWKQRHGSPGCGKTLLAKIWMSIGVFKRSPEDSNGLMTEAT